MFPCVFSFRNSIFSCSDVRLIVFGWWMLLPAWCKWIFSFWIIVTIMRSFVFNPQTRFFFMYCFLLLVFSNMFLEFFLLFFIHCQHLFFICCFFFGFFFLFFLFHKLLNFLQFFLINISYSRFSIFSCVFSFWNSVFSSTGVWLIGSSWWMLISASCKWRLSIWIKVTFVRFLILDPQTRFFFM